MNTEIHNYKTNKIKEIKNRLTEVTNDKLFYSLLSQLEFLQNE